jgi:hypothetical protein
MKKLAVVLIAVAVAALAVLPVAANGNGAQTFTTHIKNEPFTEADVVSCVEPELPAAISGTIKVASTATRKTTSARSRSRSR